MNGLNDLQLEQSLQFKYESGAITSVYRGVVSPWRTLPCANIAYLPEGEWLIEREVLPSYVVHSGETGFLPAGVRHRSTMISDGVTKCRWAHFNVFLFGYLDIFSLVETPCVFKGKVAERMGEILASIAGQLQKKNSLAGMLQRKTLEFELATLLINESKMRFEANVRLNQLQRLMPVLDEINENLAGEFTRNSMAAKVNLSSSRFAEIFKESMGLGPIDYIVRLRMQRAQSLLLNTELTVETIAANVGYDDAFYFSRLFKGHYGLSPRNFRNSHSAPSEEVN